MTEPVVEIKLASSDAEIDRCYPVMAELRPHVSREAFGERIRRQMNDHRYSLACVTEDGRVRAVAGFRLSECLAWGHFMYVDDLVTAAAARSRGYGRRLLQWLVERARSEGCEQFHLDSGVQRFDAHRFYLRHRMRITSHHFVLMLDRVP